MLLKLLKYDLKSYYKKLLPMLVFVLGAGIVSGLIQKFVLPAVSGNLEIIGLLFSIVVAVFYVSLVALALYSLLLVVLRFYNNVLKSEGYLTNTLPVKKSTILNSKILSALILGIVAFIYIDLTLFINIWIAHGLSEAMNVLPTFNFTGLDSGFAIMLFLQVIILIILGILGSILFFYSSLSLGHSKSNNKMLWSIGAGFINYMIYSIVSVGVLIVIIAGPSGGANVDTMNEYNAVMMIMTTLNILSLVYVVIQYFLTTYSLKNKLNLE